MLFYAPSFAGASWPFSTTHAETTPSPVLHDPSLDLMQAPMSTNVDDSISPTALTTPDGTAMVSGVDFDTSPISPTATDDSGDTQINSPSDPSSKGSISTYTVKSGDSLSVIAQNYGVSVNTILWANNIKDPSTIKQGTKLVILPVSGIQHTVRKGETLSTIAKKFGADAADIAQFNGISADAPLVAGSTIIIPGGELSNTSDASTNASTNTKSSSTKGSKTATSKTASGSSKTSAKGTSGMNFSDASGNPYKGGGGAPLPGFFSNPLPGAILTQGLHGWDAVDLGAPSGTPIHAAASGTVILSRTGGWNGGYGNYVILDNGSGVKTLYAHMSSVKAEDGELVSAGEVIGYVGTTGDATGPHLHFEVRGAQNPFSYCTPMRVCSI